MSGARWSGCLVLSGSTVIVGLLVAMGGPGLVWPLLLAVGAVSMGCVITAQKGVAGLLAALMVATAFLVPMNGLRIGELMTVSDAFLLVAIPLFALRRLSGVATRSGPYRPFITSLVVVACGGLVATLASSNPAAGLPGLVRFSLSTMTVVFLVALWSPDMRGLRIMIWAYVLGSTVSVAVGFVSGGYGLSGRAVGLATHPNHLGLICMFAGGGAAALGLESAGGRRRKVAFSLAGLQVAGIVLSGSRGAMLGLAVSVVAFVVAAGNWQIIRRAIGLSALVLCGALAASAFLPGVNAIERITGGDPTTIQSNREREVAVEGALDQIKASPFLGSGFEYALSAHSLYLQIWVSAGLIGVAGFLRLTWWSARLLRREHRDPFFAALMATFIGYLGTGVISTVLWDRYVWLFLGLTLATVGASSQSTAATRVRRDGDGARVVAI